MFYSHTEELTGWLGELRVELQSEEVADALEGAERLLEQFGIIININLNYIL